MPDKTTTTSVEDLQLEVDNHDAARAAEIYREHGAVVMRGLSQSFVAPVLRDMDEILAQAESLLPQAVKSDKHASSWVTPDRSLFNEDPDQPGRMVVNTLKFSALVSAAFLNSLLNPRLLDVLERILGPDIELWK